MVADRGSVYYSRRFEAIQEEEEVPESGPGEI
jgi:hypothetical protein